MYTNLAMGGGGVPALGCGHNLLYSMEESLLGRCGGGGDQIKEKVQKFVLAHEKTLINDFAWLHRCWGDRQKRDNVKGERAYGTDVKKPFQKKGQELNRGRGGGTLLRS